MTDIKIPWWQPQFNGSELARLTSVIQSNFLNDGPLTTEFERRIGELLGCKHVVAVTSGTAALFLALKSLGIGSGDEVIVPDVTFIATANAVTMTGARPVIVDVGDRLMEDTTICTKKCEDAITSKTRAIIPVHVSGRDADMGELLCIAEDNDLFIVEDAAEAFMSKSYTGACLGTIGNLGCFSLSPNKTISTGQGGFVVTNDSNLHQKLRELKDQGRSVRGTGGDDTHPTYGFNFKFTDLQAAVGLAQLEALEDRLARLVRNYELYFDALSDLSDIFFFDFATSHNVPQWTDVSVQCRDELYSYLLDRGIQCRKFWHPLHRHAAYCQPDKKFPFSTAVSYSSMWLPSAFTLTDDQILTVCQHIRDFYN